MVIERTINNSKLSELRFGKKKLARIDKANKYVPNCKTRVPTNVLFPAILKNLDRNEVRKKNFSSQGQTELSRDFLRLKISESKM